MTQDDLELSIRPGGEAEVEEEEKKEEDKRRTKRKNP